MDAATLERLGTSGLLAVILLGILYERERRYQKERTESREDLARAFAMINALHGDMREVIEKSVTASVELKSWLQGKLG